MILFIHTGLSPFVQNDLEILLKADTVKTHHYRQSKKMSGHLLSQFRLLGWLIRHIFQAETIFIWFADYHSLLPVFFARLFRKKVYIVIGGYDVTYIPEIDYGSLKNPVRKFCSLFSMKHATLNLPVSDNLAEDAGKLLPQARIKTVYTGYSPQKFYPAGDKDDKLVLTVGAGDTLQRIRLKGIDIFIELARRLPDFSFQIVGLGTASLEHLGDLPPNVHITGKVDQSQLISFYRKAKVYAQFSMREGLPNVVCEAMLCGCVPVGFNNGGISIAIGDAGYIVEDKDLVTAEKYITAAAASAEEALIKARRRIMDHFPDTRREETLMQLVKG